MKTYFLIDRSGSMASRWEETMQALKAYASEMKKGSVHLTVFDKFGGEPVLRVITEHEKLSKWSIDKTMKAIQPRGMTPLNDAVGLFASNILSNKNKKVAIVIVTDGMENASTEYTQAKAKALLQECRDRTYDVVFLGADFENAQQAADLGNKSGQTITMTTGNYVATAGTLAARHKSYALNPQDTVNLAFTDDERRRATKGS